MAPATHSGAAGKMEPGSEARNGRQDITKFLGEREALAAQYASRGQFHKAELVEAKILDVSLSVYGEEDERTLRAIENLGSFHFNQGHLDESERFLNRVVQLQKKV